MGTRALIHIKEKGLNSATLVTIYRQFDGYPSCLGVQIVKTLNNGKCIIKNGYSVGDTNPEVFNGMGCLAAYLICELKDQIGNVYIMRSDIEGVCEEYVYTLYENEGEVCMRLNDFNEEHHIKLNDEISNVLLFLEKGLD